MAPHNICKSRLLGVMAGKMDKMSASAFQNTEDGKSILKKERSRWDIIMEMLRLTQEVHGTKKTQIMHNEFIDWRIFDKYFHFLLNEGFIAKCNPEKTIILQKREENYSKD